MSDAHPLHRMMKENSEQLLHTFPLTAQGTATIIRTRKYILQKQSDRKAGSMLVCGIYSTATEELIGHVLFTKFDWTVPKCDMGYFIRKGQTGKGLATKAARLFAAWGFSTLKLEKITMRIWPENVASLAVARKLGAREAGLAKRDFRSLDGRLLDCALFELYR